MLPVDRIAAELIGCTKSALHRERHVAVEWQLLKVQRTLALQDDKCQVPTAAVIGLQNLTGCIQPCPAIEQLMASGVFWLTSPHKKTSTKT